MINSEKTGKERRQSYRIIYSGDYHPKLVVKDHEFDILDLSETGIRFKLIEKIKIPGDLFHARVKIHDGSAIEVIGRINRITGDQAAMFMVVKKIPYQIILSEQAYLRQKDGE